MRKMLVMLGALMLSAAPAAAQQSGPSAPADVPVAAAQTSAPSLFPSTDQVRAEVRATEATRESRSRSMGQRDFIYLVAAIVVGVIIAAVVLD
jgi:hypothetical protein